LTSLSSTFSAAIDTFFLTRTGLAVMLHLADIAIDERRTFVLVAIILAVARGTVMLSRTLFEDVLGVADLTGLWWWALVMVAKICPLTG